MSGDLGLLLRPLACPYCGGKLTVNTETTGRAYLSYEVPESITCDEMGCQAVWEPDGTPRDLPAFAPLLPPLCPPTPRRTHDEQHAQDAE